MAFYPPAGTLLIGWLTETDAAKDELKAQPTLEAQMESMHDRKHAWLLENLDARTGMEAGALVVDTGKGSFHIETAYAVGGWVVIVDSDGRSSSLLSIRWIAKRRLFWDSIFSFSGPRVCSRSRKNREPWISTLPTSRAARPSDFSSPVSIWSFC